MAAAETHASGTGLLALPEMLEADADEAVRADRHGCSLLAGGGTDVAVHVDPPLACTNATPPYAHQPGRSIPDCSSNAAKSGICSAGAAHVTPCRSSQSLATGRLSSRHVTSIRMSERRGDEYRRRGRPSLGPSRQRHRRGGQCGFAGRPPVTRPLPAPRPAPAAQPPRCSDPAAER